MSETTEVEILSGANAGRFADVTDEGLQHLDGRAIEYRIVPEAERQGAEPGLPVDVSPEEYPALDRPEPELQPAPEPAPAPPAMSKPRSVFEGLQKFLSFGVGDLEGLAPSAAGLGAAAYEPGFERAAGRGVGAPTLSPEQQEGLAFVAARDAKLEDYGRAAETPVMEVSPETQAAMLGVPASAARAYPNAQPTPVSGLDAGQMLGAAATLPIGGSQQAAATWPGRLAQAVGLSGAPAAVAAGAGAEDPEQLGERAGVGLASGTALGFGAGEAVRAAPKAMQWLRDKVSKKGDQLGDYADELELRAQGAERGPQNKLRDKGGQAAVHAQAQAQRDQGIGKGALPPTVRERLEQAQEAQAAASAQKDALAAQAAEMTVSRDQVARHIEGKLTRELTLLEESGELVPGASENMSTVRSIADEFRGAGESEFGRMGNETTFERLNQWRNFWGRNTNFESGSMRQKMRQKVYGALNEVMEELAEEAGEGIGRAWRDANRAEHHAITAQDFAQRHLSTSGNRFFSLTDNQAAVGGGLGALAAGGDPLTAGLAAAAGAGVNKLWRGREHGHMARAVGGLSSGARRLARALEPGDGSAGRVALAARPTASAAAAPSPPAMVPAMADDTDPQTVLALIERDPDLYGEHTEAIRAAAARGDVEGMKRAIEAALRGAN